MVPVNWLMLSLLIGAVLLLGVAKFWWSIVLWFRRQSPR
jgi:hypothetical protein